MKKELLVATQDLKPKGVFWLLPSEVLHVFQMSRSHQGVFQNKVSGVQVTPTQCSAQGLSVTWDTALSHQSSEVILEIPEV